MWDWIPKIAGWLLRLVRISAKDSNTRDDDRDDFKTVNDVALKMVEIYQQRFKDYSQQFAEIEASLTAVRREAEECEAMRHADAIKMVHLSARVADLEHQVKTLEAAHGEERIGEFVRQIFKEESGQ